jgi:hypothetical protein
LALDEHQIEEQTIASARLEGPDDVILRTERDHDYEGQIADTLPGELDEIRAAIIAGDIKVTSYLNP